MEKYNNSFSWILTKAFAFIGVILFTIFLTLEYEKNLTDLITFSLNNPVNIFSLFIIVILLIISEIKLQEAVKENS